MKKITNELKDGRYHVLFLFSKNPDLQLKVFLKLYKNPSLLSQFSRKCHEVVLKYKIQLYLLFGKVDVFQNKILEINRLRSVRWNDFSFTFGQYLFAFRFGIAEFEGDSSIKPLTVN